MGSVIPGKIDPNYQGDLRYAEAIPGTAFAVTDKNEVKPISTPSQPFQEQYYKPGWTYSSHPAVVSGSPQADPSSQVRTVLVNAESYQNIQRQKAAEEAQRKAWFGIPAKLKSYNEKGFNFFMGVGARAYGTTPEKFEYAYETAKAIHKAAPMNTPGTPKIVSDYGAGVVTGAIEKPATTAAALAAGGAVGSAFRLAPAALELSGVAKLITASEAATKATAGIGKAIPVVLGGIYAADVGYSTYQQPAGTRAYYLGQRTSTEFIPLTVGGMAGYKAADKLIGGTKYSLTDRITAYNRIYGLPKEQQAAAKATYESYLKVYGVKTPLQGAKPDFTGIKNLGSQGPKVGSIIRQEPHTFFGSSSWSWQRPKAYVDFRGAPSDLDAMVSAPSKTAGRITKGASGFKLDTGRPGLVINTKTGSHAVDLHTPPENYPGFSAKEGTTGADIVDSVLQAAPKSKKGIVTTPEGTYEIDWVQSQRKMASIFGETGKDYGPPEHRMKDAMDTILDMSYYGEQGYNLKPEFTTLKKYWTDPKVYNKYIGGKEYAKAIGQIEYGKTPAGRVKTTKTPALVSPKSTSGSGITGLKVSGIVSPSTSRSVKPSKITVNVPKVVTSPSPSKVGKPTYIPTSPSPSVRPSVITSTSPRPSTSRTPSPVTPTPSVITGSSSPSPSPSPSVFYYTYRTPSPYTYKPPTPSIIPPPILGSGSFGRGGGGRSGAWFRKTTKFNPVPTLASFMGGYGAGMFGQSKSKKKKWRLFV